MKIKEVLPNLKVENAHIVVGLHTHAGFEPLGGSYFYEDIVTRFGDCVIKKTHILNRVLQIYIE